MEFAETDAQGDYLFSKWGVLDEIFLEFELPQTYSFTSQDQGDDDSLGSDAYPLSGQTIAMRTATITTGTES